MPVQPPSQRSMTRLIVPLILGTTTAALILPRVWAGWRYGPFIYTVETSPSAPIGVVFGAGLRRDGRPTRVLADRVAAAADLYHHGKVRRLLMSGTRRGSYDEPVSMQNLAIELGVPAQAIDLDPAGFRTFDTCRHVQQGWTGVPVILVSQAYHLPRALATCRGLGVRATGVAPHEATYRPMVQAFWLARELPATLVALWDTVWAPPMRPTADKLPDVEGDARHGS